MQGALPRDTAPQGQDLVQDVVALFASRGERPAVVTAETTVTYAELGRRVHDLAQRLGPVRRLVLVEGGNTLDALVGYLAGLASRCPVLLVPAGADQARASLVERYDPDVVLTADGGLHTRRDGTAHDLHPDLALLLSTSGSTGSPKLVRLSRRNLAANARSIASYLAIREDDRAVTTLPLAYCYGLSVVNSHLLAGASLLLTDLSVADACFWRLFAEHRATCFAGVPYTFDLLDRVGFAQMHLPRLRYVTQAGGRLAPERVRAYARLGQRKGFDLYVMYGQTEATARMAYLPPDLAAEHPATIGVPVPGGAFRLDPVPGSDASELVYLGANVMMGYAEAAADLARGPELAELRTGDLARRTPEGLYQVVGRRSRFAKVFGLRIDLERLEATLAARGWTTCCVDGDAVLVVAAQSPADPARVQRDAARASGLPRGAVRVVPVDALPRLANGKPDLVEVRRRGERPTAAPVVAPATGDVAGLRRLVAQVLERPLDDVGPGDTFVGLGGDSLSYVEMSVRLEEVLGRLPEGWQTTPLQALAALPAADRPAGRLRSRWRTLETAVGLRALAVLLVVAAHSDLVELRGGAHLLLVLAGVSLARLQLTVPDRRARTAALLRGTRRIVVPTVVWIAAVHLLTGQYLPANVVLLNGLLGPPRLAPSWEFWFVEALVAALLGVTALLAVPAVDRLERRAPFAFAGALFLASLVLRWHVRLEPGGADRVYGASAVLWLVVLGWAAARACDRPRRLLVAAAAVLTVPGFFQDPAREGVVLAGALLVLAAPEVRVPARVQRALGAVAGASLYVYLVHWQVFPHLEASSPLLALAASLAAGLAYQRLWRAGCAGAGAARRLVVPAVPAVPEHRLVAGAHLP